MADNQTFEQILAEIEAETKPEVIQQKISGLSDEDKKKVGDHLVQKAIKAKTDADAELARVTALKQEGQRVDQKNQDANKTFEQRMREENTEKALSVIFSEMGVDKEEEKQSIRKELEARKPQAVTVENLVLEARRAWGAVNPDKAIEAMKRVKDLQRGAADFNAQGARNSGTGEGGGGDEFSPEAHQIQENAARNGVTITLEQAQDYFNDTGGTAPTGHVPNFVFSKDRRKKK